MNEYLLKYYYMYGMSCLMILISENSFYILQPLQCLWIDSWENVEFSFIEDCLASSQVLEFPNFEGEFFVWTVASGFVLVSAFSNSNGKPVAYASETLNKT